MKPQHTDPKTMHHLLRQYLLDTLEPALKNKIEQYLTESKEWRAALDAERKAMGVLDLLPEIDPPSDLTKGVMAHIRNEEREKQYSRRPLDLRMIYSTVACVAMVLVIAVILLPALSRSRESARSASSENNLREMGVVLKMYAHESNGHLYPRLTPFNKIWMVDIEEIGKEYLPDPVILVNPKSSTTNKLLELWLSPSVDLEQVTRIAAKDYVYLGWIVTDNEDVKELAAARASSQLSLDEDLLLSSGRKLLRLREGVESSLISGSNNPGSTAEIMSKIPIMFESSFKDQCNVLYLDGHVECIPYGHFPCTAAVRDALGLPAE